MPNWLIYGLLFFGVTAAVASAVGHTAQFLGYL